MIGRHYTPAPLASEVVRRVLAPLFGRKRLRILDPACGAGVFLHAARRFLGPDHTYVGVDLDPAGLAQVGPGFDLREGDALKTDWGDERFDAVVGNPPWVSFSGRHAVALAEEERRHLATFETFAGWPSLHAPFTELAVSLATARVGLLLPAQVCELERYAPLRAYLRKHCRVLEAPQYGEGVFAGVVQPTCALILERGSEEGGGTPFDARPDPFAHCPRPPPDAFGDIGVHTGNCARQLIVDGIVSGIVSGGAPIREGRDVDAFTCRDARRGLRADYEKAHGEYFRVASLERYRAVPILLRQTASRPIAALHTAPTYFRNSLLACLGIEGVEPAKVVAWLNSTPIGWFHRQTIREANQRSFPQVKLRHLRNLPLPDWTQVEPDQDVPWSAFGVSSLL